MVYAKIMIKRLILIGLFIALDFVIPRYVRTEDIRQSAIAGAVFVAMLSTVRYFTNVLNFGLMLFVSKALNRTFKFMAWLDVIGMYIIQVTFVPLVMVWTMKLTGWHILVLPVYIVFTAIALFLATEWDRLVTANRFLRK